jgi:hypothetical protein
MDNQDIDFESNLPDELQPQNQLVASNVRELAKTLDYNGPLSVGSLEDEVRMYQRRTAEACVELGKRLLLIKEMAPRGHFDERAKLLGFSRTSAYRFMQAAKKFSNRPKLGQLVTSNQSAAKYLELLMLDDEELDLMEEGVSPLDVHLDEIQCMSASELRQAIRDRDKKIENHAKHNSDLEHEKLTLKDELRAAQGRQTMAGYNPQTVAIRMEATAAAYGVQIHVDELTALYEAALEKEAPTMAEYELRVKTVALAVSASFAHIHSLYERLAAELGGGVMPVQPGGHTPLTDNEKALLQRSILSISHAFQTDKSVRAAKRKIDQIAKGGKPAKE